MHGFYRVTAVSLDTKVADPEHNYHQIKTVLSETQDSNVVVFPELALSGYTCGDLFGQTKLLDACDFWLKKIAGLVGPQLVFVGAPFRFNTALYNCAFVFNQGECIGIVPKQYLPNYKEFYEARWFHPGKNLKMQYVDFYQADGRLQQVRFSPNLIFACKKLKVFTEICEDIWMPIPPSSYAAIAGAQVLCNLSSSNETVAKADYRRNLVVGQSGRCIGAYVYSSSGPSESTNDVVFGGHCLIAENGSLLTESDHLGDGKLNRSTYWITSDVDVEKLNNERRQTTSFAFSDEKVFTEVPFLTIGGSDYLRRKVTGRPFVPLNKSTLAQRCQEVFDIAVCGLAKRIEQLNPDTPITIGVSGGLDSTLALLIAVKAKAIAGISNKKILGFAMPGFGTTDKTKNNSFVLMEELGIPYKVIDIRPACMQMFKDMGHKPFGIDVTNLSIEDFMVMLRKLPENNRDDLVFENVQARVRTSILMNSGFVLGTGDLSEIALGWCTYNADQMSMYNPNCSIPKTLVKFLVEYCANQHTGKLQEVLLSIAGTTISPELLPTNEAGEIVQSTEGTLGAYELQDFFLYNFVRNGFSPEKILFLAKYADFSKVYTDGEIAKALKVFCSRFFRNQFKREAVPDGPKVGSVSLSPRGDWRMPSDASSRLWTE